MKIVEKCYIMYFTLYIMMAMKENNMKLLLDDQLGVWVGVF